MDLQDIKDNKELREARYSLVVKSNDLLRKSRYTLSATEQKIIIWLISKIKADDKELNCFEIDIKEFCEVANIQLNGEAYNRIKSTIKQISDRSWWLASGENKEVLFRWVDKAEIEKGSGTITIQLSGYLKPYLLELKKQFTAFELINVLVLHSKYSIRLYELFKSYLFQGEWQISITELKNILDIKDKYDEFKELKRRVLQPAIEEINKYTDLVVEMETLRKGRNISHIHFTIEEKQGYQVLMPLLENQKERLG